jgi:hypothetical protein
VSPSVCSLIARERANRTSPNLAWLLRGPGRGSNSVKTPAKMSRVPFPMRAVPVAQKLTQQKNGAQTKVVCFEEHVTETHITTLKTRPVFDCRRRLFPYPKITQARRTPPRSKMFVSVRRLKEQKPQHRKNCPGLQTR